MNGDNDKNALVYLLAGFGLGALIGAVAGLLLAPKSGTDTRHELNDRLRELKSKTEDYISEQRAKRRSLGEASADEVGA
jgi:gas vesicle protein